MQSQELLGYHDYEMPLMGFWKLISPLCHIIILSSDGFEASIFKAKESDLRS